MKRYAIFGGTFDPFTPAHKAIVNAVLDIKSDGINGTKLIDKVYIAPTVVDYYRSGKDSWLSPTERIKCISRGMMPLTCGKEYDIWDFDLKKKVLLKTDDGKDNLKSYRFIDTLLEFKAHVLEDGDEVYVVLGTDSYNNFGSWACYKEILEQAKLIVVLGRDGEELKTSYGVDVLTVKIPSHYSGMSASKFREDYKPFGLNVYMNTVLRDYPVKLLHTPIFDVMQMPPVEEANGLAPVVVKAPDWVTFIVEYNGCWLVETQFRFGKMQNVSEFPCGMVEEKEDPKEAAIRELREETGIKLYDTTKVKYLGCMSPNPAFMANKMSVFYVNLDKTMFTQLEQQLDEHENIKWKFESKEAFEKQVLEQVLQGPKSKKYNPAMLLAAMKIYDWAKKNGKLEE